MKNPFIHTPNLFVALVLGLLLSSCKTVQPEASLPTPPPIQEPIKKKTPTKLYDWKGDEVEGPLSIIIYLDKQKAELFKGDQLVGWTYVATGRASHPTPTGEFRVSERTKDKASNVYGRLLNAEGKTVDSDYDARKGAMPEGHSFSGAKMPYFMRLTGDGVGLHIGPIPRPGRPASHGCIRVPRGVQPKIFASSKIGTSVKIVASAPGPLAHEIEQAKAELAATQEDS